MSQDKEYPLEKRNQDLVPSLEQTAVEHISAIMDKDPQKMVSDAERERELQSRAYEALRSIQNEYSALSRHIMVSSRGSMTVMDSIRNVANSRGIKGKTKAILKVGNNSIERVPVIGYLKVMAQHKLSGDTHINRALETQFHAATNLQTRLAQFLYGDKGSLAEQFGILNRSVEEYEQRIVELKIKHEEYDAERGESSDKLGHLVSGLESRLSAGYEDIDPEKLGAEDTKIYFEAESIRRELDQVGRNSHKTGKDIDILQKSIAGKRVTQATLAIYQTTGQEIYDKLRDFLSGAQEDVGAMAVIAEAEKVIVDASLQANMLKQSYNALLLMTTQHGAILSEHGEGLVPDSLHDPLTLVEAMKNVTRGARNYQKRTGSNGTLNAAKALEQLTRGYLEEQQKRGDRYAN